MAAASSVTRARLGFASITFPLVHACACSIAAETVSIAIIQLRARKFRAGTSEPWRSAVFALAKKVITVTVSTASLWACKERLVAEFATESGLAHAVASDAFTAVEALSTAHLL